MQSNFAAKAVKMDYKKNAALIRFHRKKAGLSRQALALHAGLGKTAIFDIESGKPTVQLDTFLKTLETLNIKIRLDGPFVSEFEKGWLEAGARENIENEN